MSLLLQIANIYVPAFVKRKYFTRLFSATAEAFHTHLPNMSGWKYDRFLQEYAVFTRKESDELFRQGIDIEPVKKSLFDGAMQLGSELRRILKVRTRRDIMLAGRMLYRMLGIDFRMNPEGEITIGRCYFSKFYSAETCRLISSLDAGILAGISGGGKLVFINRITEKADSCHANLIFPEEHR